MIGVEHDLSRESSCKGSRQAEEDDRSTVTTPTRDRKSKLLQDQVTIMKKKEIESPASAVDSSPITGTMGSNSLFTRREMLGVAGMAGLAAGPDAVAQTARKRPRIACLVSYWGLPTSHADWIVTKLIDGYWWKGAHTPSRGDVVSVYVH